MRFDIDVKRVPGGNRNVLKSLSLICAVGAMAFRPKRWEPRVIDGGLLKAHDIDVVTDLASVPPVPEPMPSVPLTKAMPAFLTELMDMGAGNDFRLQHIIRSYEQLRFVRGWPPVSTKTMSVQLVKLGCVRTKLDLRSQGIGRPVALRLPKARAA